MHRKKNELPFVPGVKADKNWLYPFANQSTNELETETAAQELTAIQEQIATWELNGFHRELFDDEIAALEIANQQLEYTPTVVLEGFDENVEKGIQDANFDGFVLAQELMEDSNFSTFAVWKEVLTYHAKLSAWQQQGTNCTFENFFTDDGYTDYFYLINSSASSPRISLDIYYFDEEENYDLLKMFAYLEGFRSYFKRIEKHIEIPGYNAYTLAKEKDKIEKSSISFDGYAIRTLQRYYWLYANIEGALESGNGERYDFNTFMSGIDMLLYRNDEVSGSRVIHMGGGDIVDMMLLTDYTVVDREISPTELKIGLQEMKAIAINIVRYCRMTEVEWHELWGINQGDSLEKGQSEILRRRANGIAFLEEHKLLSKYITGGKIDLSNFKLPQKFWEFSEKWEISARRQLISEIVKDLARITGLVDQDDIYILEMGETMGRRRPS